MNKAKFLKLWFGPYRPPRVLRGGFLICKWRGKVKVGDYSHARIPWPMKESTRSLILCGDLVRAVRSEAAVAVAYHWGVRLATVWKWRQLLGLRQPTAGTQRLIRLIKEANQDHATRTLSRFFLRPRASEAVRRRQSQRTRQQIATRPMQSGLKLWSAEEEKLLGTRPDPELAKVLGRSVTALCQRRALRNIPSKPAIDWSPAILTLLGTKPDQEIADVLGCSAASVTLKRQALGIPPHRLRWSPAEIRLLGTLPDSQVARLVNRNAGAVGQLRMSKGIPAFVSKHQWEAKEDRQLGTDTDKAVARLLGRSVESVRYRRTRLGIPLKPEAFWSAAEVSLLGKLPDTEVARRLKRSPSAVKQKRQQLGIAAPPSARRRRSPAQR